VKNVANLIGPGRCEAASRPELWRRPKPWRRSAPGRAPSGQGNLRPSQKAPLPGAPSAAATSDASCSLLSSRQRPLFGRRGICFYPSRRCMARVGNLFARLKAAATKSLHKSRFTSHQSPAYARYRDTSHFSIPYTLGNRNQCNSLKTHADAMFYPLHSPGVVHIVFILKGSAN